MKTVFFNKTIPLIILWIAFQFNNGFAQLVLPGDYPDPSIVMIKDTYWASATTSNWAPAYPLLKSKDLIHWTSEGFVFNQLPDWADYYFWAPEISYENGKVYVYYSAHKRDGNLCLGIASADKPEGPYRDHGPVMCQEAGSIDAFPMRDENGKLYLIWKEDGNSVNKPTPIWAMEMKEDRSALVGQKTELFRNDAAWEGNLVEGVSMIKHGRYYYAFYAARGCCGRGCTYTTGVARAENLLGPWEKYEENPVLKDQGDWKCPGHGTPVEKDGKFYFLYHAYHKEGGVSVGRQGLLKEFRFTPDHWIEFVETENEEASIPHRFEYDFDEKTISNAWQWSVFQDVRYVQQGGKLTLYALAEDYNTFIGHKVYQPEFQVNVVVDSRRSDGEAGLAVIGDDQHMVGVSVHEGTLRVWKIDGREETQFLEKKLKNKGVQHLHMKVTEGKNIVFLHSTNGETYEVLNEQPIDGSFLPPWDRAIRVGLTARGQPGEKAVFEKFTLTNSITDTKE